MKSTTRDFNVAYRSTAIALLGLAACSADPAPASAQDASLDQAAAASARPPAAKAALTFESGPVRPVALAADGERVFVANTPNGSLDILRVTRNGLVPDGSAQVGIDPVALAFRN